VDLDAHLGQVRGGTPLKRRWKRGQNRRRGVEEDDPRLGRVDAASGRVKNPRPPGSFIFL
jgi:hypothetical protein